MKQKNRQRRKTNMAILKSKDIAKMNPAEIKEKMKELKLELVKSRIATKKTGKGTREIKRTIAKLMTFEKINERKNNGNLS
jgi:ribosomal protein L29